MASNIGKVMVQWVVALLLIAMVREAMAVPLCNIDTSKLHLCHSAVTGISPPPPTKRCCNVLHHANLPCLCSFKSLLPRLGIDQALALVLPKNCGLKTPPECKSKPFLLMHISRLIAVTT
ncbi:LTP_2 domain-containing protein [Cephalotus follicularis]|uniref:LTP_2 domain-containing protein n=1 Tax=Cephalotus follicularis TaxID=3775 RepID=A0A1Q3D421_CEPFO|nr:LTP_2 domain-containing protein [Cephalotus follicularis]